VGGGFSGGVAPGYCIDPLRGSRMDRAGDVLGAQKAGKTPSGPLGLNCSTETSNSSSFGRRAAGDEESRISLRMRRARSFATLRMTAEKGFPQPVKASPSGVRNSG